MTLTTVVENEIAKYANTLDLLEQGAVDEDKEFKPYRLVHGIYGQRQGGTNQMVRIKLQTGRLSPHMMRVLADTSERYATGVSHITTRQAIQFHFVPLEHTPKLMHELEEAGMTTREACGNAVRGVVCSPLAGTQSEELFDVQPYADQIFQHFLRGPRSSDLPRKFKIGFAGHIGDPQAFNNIQDIGVCPVVVDGQQGFRIRAGGGLGSMPVAPIELYECLPKDRLVPVCEAILRVHHVHGDRENRAKARLKFVLRKHGHDGFRQLFEEQLAAVDGEGITGSELADDLPTNAPGTIPSAPSAPSAEGVEGEWLRTNVTPHREAGKSVVAINIPLGDITADKMRLLASLAEDYTAGDVSVSVDQNLYFRQVPIDRLHDFYEELTRVGFVGQSNQITDVLSCPGASTCQLGITLSKNMAADLEEKLGDLKDDTGVRNARIKISGCPNSCGQHHIGTIGLHGAAAKIGDKLVPHYVLMVGGVDNGAEVHHGQMIARIPARKVVDVIHAITAWYVEDRSDENEPLDVFLRRVSGATLEDKKEARAAKKAFKQRLEPVFAYGDGELQESDLFDIGSDKLFSLDEIGAGECMS